MDRETAIRRARGLFALTTKNNSDHEASLATDRLKTIMREHGLVEEDITGVQPTDVGEWEAPGSFNASWRLSMMTFVATVYGCKAIRAMEVKRDGSSHSVKEVWSGKVVGRRSDADATIYTFRCYENALIEQCKKAGYHLASESDEDSFMRGAAYGLFKRVEEQTRNIEKKVVPTPAAARVMVPAEKVDPTDTAKRYLDTKYPVREKKRQNDHASNYDVFYSGYNAAQNVRLISPDASVVMGLIEEEKKAGAGAAEQPAEDKKRSNG